MKIKLEDLKKAINWIEQNSRDILLTLDVDKDRESYLKITCQDKYETYVEIKIFNEGTMLPKMVTETNLP